MCNIYVMKRTTVFLEDAILKRIKRLAAKEGKSFAAVVREALVAYAVDPGRVSRRVPAVAGQFASGHSDTADRVDELLWQDPHR